MSQRKYLTTKELTELWGLDDPETVSNYAADGRIPGAFKMGNRWRFDPDRATLLPKPEISREKRRYTRRVGIASPPPTASAGRAQSEWDAIHRKLDVALRARGKVWVL
jgi:hypothetical protein